MASMTGSVDINHVTLRYSAAGGGVLALRDTSLNVRRGAFAAVVGPSGCGKSSLMKIVTGLVPPDSGHVVVCGDWGEGAQGPAKPRGTRSKTPHAQPGPTVMDNGVLRLEIVEPHRRKFRRE